MDQLLDAKDVPCFLGRHSSKIGQSTARVIVRQAVPEGYIASQAP